MPIRISDVQIHQDKGIRLPVFLKLVASTCSELPNIIVLGPKVRIHTLEDGVLVF